MRFNQSTLLAVFFIASSKLVSYQFAEELSRFINDIIVDTILELGTALLDAVATVFYRVPTKKQFNENIALRNAIEKRIADL